jgi:hypothetical protein
MNKIPSPGQIVEVGEQRGIVLDPQGLDIPDDEIVVWFGRIAPNGSLQVFTTVARSAVLSVDVPQVFR